MLNVYMALLFVPKLIKLQWEMEQSLRYIKSAIASLCRPCFERMKILTRRGWL
jgi:hypothetical protein